MTLERLFPSMLIPSQYAPVPRSTAVSYTHLDVYKRQLFVDAFRQQTEPQKEVMPEKTEERDPEVVAWENDEITSIEVKTVDVKSPFAPLPEEAEKAPKAHRLTAEEKEIKAAVKMCIRDRHGVSSHTGTVIAETVVTHKLRKTSAVEAVDADAVLTQAAETALSLIHI